ncbi:MAG: DUF4019 domain-containing protein [Alphaproteobacteria bacterium]|nr:DUF4019 domain-containing protein [Alphaproteobacteria bacterium]
MHRIATIIAAVALLAGCSMKADMDAGSKAIAAFHRDVDAGQYQKVWAESATDMKGSTPADRLAALLDAVHRKLGRFRSGSQVGFNDNVSGAGHTLSVTYEARYEKGAATEQFVFRMDGNRALLAGYHINSDALILG